MNEKLSIRRFNLHQANWVMEGKILSNIHRLVFTVELKLPREDESDGRNETSWHWLSTDTQDIPMGTVRLARNGQIEVLAVLENYRGTGVGTALLEQAVDKARHLGFSHVFVIVDTAIENFCQRAGFSVSNDEIAVTGSLIRMEQVLLPLDDNVQRLAAGDLDPAISVKQFDTLEVSFSEVAKIIRKIREIVFIHELGLPERLSGDEADEDAVHWVAEDKTRQIIGVIRLSGGVISHLAVMSEYRQQGVAQSLLELAVAKATRLNLDEVKFDAPTEMESFFTRAGFTRLDQRSESTNFTLQTYVRKIQLQDVHTPLQRPDVSGDHYSESSAVYRLGHDKKLILLRREQDFRNVIIEMAKQAITSVRILSPVLEHKLYDNAELRDILSALARKNRHTHIEILLYDSHRVTRSGHALLEISRKLSSSIRMKIVHPELRHLNHEYMLVDDTGIVYRLDYEVFDGYANFSDVTECNRLGRQFTAAWESGLNDPNLRQLRM